MMFAFGVIAALTLLLIFLFIKLQSSQKEANILRLEIRKTSRHVSQVTASKDALALTWQNTLINRLDAAHKRGLVNEQDANVLRTLFEGFSDLLHGCLNQGNTVEEGLIKYLADTELSVQDVKDVIKKYPKEVRLAWTKNNAEGLIVALTKLSEMLAPTKKTVKTEGEDNNDNTEKQSA